MAGLLDFLQSGPSQGGLLDLLRRSAMQQQMPSGLTSDQAQYDAPPQQQPVIQSAPLPPPSQPQQAAAMPQRQSASFGSDVVSDIRDLGGSALNGLDKFNAGLQSIGHGGSIIGAITGNYTDPTTIAQKKANLTTKALISKGIDPQIATAAAQNPELMKALISQTFGKPDMTDKIKNWQFAQSHPEFAATLQKEDADKFGLNPMYGVDEQGNPVAIQLNSKGGAQPVKLPDGIKLSKQPIKIDAGTEEILIDPITRQPVARIPKDVAGAARLKKEGVGQAEAALALPQVMAASQQMLKVINGIDNHPGKGWSLGAYSKLPTIPGTEQANFRASLDQLNGQTFLQAYQQLRGGGAITEVEGKKGENAIARLNAAQTTESFNQALADLREVINAGILRAKAKARGPVAAQPETAAAALPSSDPLGVR